MQDICDKMVQDIWAKAQIIWPKLLAYNPPKIVINRRIYRFAGRCWTSDNKIELSYKLYTKHGKVFINEILPHEIGHQIDYNLNGTPKNNRWHGTQWIIIGAKLGFEFKTYHNFEY